jgi:hypothetical protein
MKSITFNIPDAKWPVFKKAFLEVHQVPVDHETGEPTMSETAWIKEWGRLMYVGVARQGLKRVRDKEHPVTENPNVIT